jgi:hypothetical protein
MMHILVLAVLLAAGGAAAFEPNTGSSLLVQAGACSAFEFTPQPAHKFSYTLKLLSVGAASCDRGLVRWVAPRAPAPQHAVPTRRPALQGCIFCSMRRPGGQTHAHPAGGRPARRRLSKFYVKEACLKQRDNELGLDSYNTLTCPAASDAAASTCASAFQLGALYDFTETSVHDVRVRLSARRVPKRAEPAPGPGPPGRPGTVRGSRRLARSRPRAAADGSPPARPAARRHPALSLRACLGCRPRGLTALPRGRAAKPESLLTAGNVTDAQSFDSGNVCASYGDRGYAYVTNGCASPITVGLEVRRRRRARECAARRRLWAKKLLGFLRGGAARAGRPGVVCRAALRPLAGRLRPSARRPTAARAHCRPRP